MRASEVRSDIFNWMAEGYRQLIANECKIDMSDAVRQLKEDMKADSNNCRRWIRECGYAACTPTGTSDPRWKSLREWMQIYAQYCKDYSDGMPKTSKSVAKIFKEMGFESVRRPDGVWYCIGRKEDEEKAEAAKALHGVLGLADDDENIPF